VDRRITEKELILPALAVMTKYGKVNTTELIKYLFEIMQPTGKDVEIIQGRNDTFFSQKVRNLKSHDTLEGYADYNNGSWKINEDGTKLLMENEQVVDIINDMFDYQDKLEVLNKHSEKSRNKIIFYDENDVIFEGRAYKKSSTYRKRSSKLRDAAIQHYTRNNKICCEICGFNFEIKYGDLGRGYIEIHHKKPICDFAKNTNEAKLITEALRNLCPVCSNCHRMLHRKKTITYEDVLNSLKKEQIRTDF